MSVEREPRSSRRQFLGTMIGAACACGLVATATATPRARAEGSIARLDEPGTALRTAERLSLRPPPVPEGKLLFPVSPASDCYVLDNFGDARGSTRLHEGVDIMGSRGMPVFAVVAGVLTQRYTNTGTAGWGWTLYDASTKTTYKYFHLAEDAVGLSVGSAVSAGQMWTTSTCTSRCARTTWRSIRFRCSSWIPRRAACRRRSGPEASRPARRTPAR
jgi:hypothetical protein